MQFSRQIQIGEKRVGEGGGTYLIAEIGSNHNQDKQQALDMIDMAAEAGADAVKFQSLRFERLYKAGYETDDFREWFRAIELDENWYPDLAVRAKSNSVHFLSAPTYVEAIELLEECGVPAYKIASPQVQGNHDVVQAVAETNKPVIASTGYCEYGDITNLLKLLRDIGNEQLVLLHCISKYPMDPSEANLRFIDTLRKMAGSLVGFSDHSLDDHVTIAAVALGACVIEKHVTLDRQAKGPDHNFSMTFDEFGAMQRRIRDIDQAMGDGTRISLLPEEYGFREKVVRMLFSKGKIAAGERIGPQNTVWFRCSKDGITEADKSIVMGKRAAIDIGPETLITPSMIKQG